MNQEQKLESLHTLQQYYLEISKNFSSTETQKKGRLVLLVSCVSILFSLRIIEIKKLEAGVVSGEVTATKTILILLFLIAILYLGLVHYLSLKEDLGIWRMSKSIASQKPDQVIGKINKGLTNALQDVIDASNKSGFDATLEAYNHNIKIQKEAAPFRFFQDAHIKRFNKAFRAKLVMEFIPLAMAAIALIVGVIKLLRP